jgi:iron(III) transport system ATP-binding protein
MLSYMQYNQKVAEKNDNSISVSASNAIEVRNLAVHYGGVLAVKGVSFSVAPGEHLTLLGPSGCGKTTTLRCLAGLETPTSGEIRIGGEVVFSSERGISRPTEKRNISMVFQSYAIWPHMTIFENVAYGLRLRNYSRQEIEKRVEEVLQMVDMAQYAPREASRLSGGQQQRVALARGIAFHPRALLMDEPLSNLDARLRDQMRDVIKGLQKKLGMTTVYVTHDQEEALALSDRIIVMRNGRIEQEGSPFEIYNTPRTPFVADFVGAANIVKGRLLSKSVDMALLEADGGIVLTCAPSDRVIGLPENSLCSVAIRTVHPSLYRSKEGIDTNIWPGIVKRSVYLGDTLVYTVSWGAGELEVRTLPGEPFKEGEQVFIHIDPDHLIILEIDADASD